MSKYKCLNGMIYHYFKEGKIYEDEFKPAGCIYTAIQMVRKDPKYWQLIEEEMKEKNITLTLDQARKMYGKNTELDVLLLANFTKDELTKKDLPKSWNEIKVQFGYKLSNIFDGFVERCPKLCSSTYNNRGIFATEKQAESALAMAQLSQLMAVYNDGWAPNFKDLEYKYIIRVQKSKIECDYTCYLNCFLTFKSAELRDEFLKNFEPLIKEYFMID